MNSNKFNVADQITNCGQGACNPKGDDGLGSSTNTSVSNFTGQAAVAVDGSLQADLNFCGGSQVQVGPGTVFEAVDSGTGTWTITTQVAKSELVDPSRGASQYDMCLGTTNLSKAPYVGNPGDQATCVNNDSYSWPAKGGCATYDGIEVLLGQRAQRPRQHQEVLAGNDAGRPLEEQDGQRRPRGRLLRSVPLGRGRRPPLS